MLELVRSVDGARLGRDRDRPGAGALRPAQVPDRPQACVRRRDVVGRRARNRIGREKPGTGRRRVRPLRHRVRRGFVAPGRARSPERRRRHRRRADRARCARRSKAGNAAGAAAGRPRRRRRRGCADQCRAGRPAVSRAEWTPGGGRRCECRPPATGSHRDSDHAGRSHRDDERMDGRRPRRRAAHPDRQARSRVERRRRQVSVQRSRRRPMRPRSSARSSATRCSKIEVRDRPHSEAATRVGDWERQTWRRPE